MLSNLSPSPNPLLGTLSCSLMPHIQLFSSLPIEVPPHFPSHGQGLTSMHTTAVQSPSHYQWSIGKQWYQLPEFIPSNSNSGLHSCISVSVYTHLNNKSYPLTPDMHWHRCHCLYTLHLCILYLLLDSCNLYKQMSSSLCTWYPLYHYCTLPVYPLLTTSTLYWIITNASTTDTTWPSALPTAVPH